MTNGTSQTPPPPPTGGPAYGAAPPSPAKKKGLSPLAWVGIGCGVIVVLGLIVMVVAGALGMRWLGGKAKEFEANPAMAAAKLMVKANPEVELVEADDEAGTLTVRNKKTGEVVTVNLDEVEEGRISFEADGETTTMGMEKGEDGEGSFTVRGADGKTRLRVGAGGEEDLPGWLPRYEGVTPQGTYFSASGGTVNGGYSFETADSVDDVIGYFRDELEDAGMTETGNSNTTSGSSRFSNVSYEGDGRTVTLVVTSDGDETNVIVSYSAPEEE
jgi:VCBS repeat-containing protein